MSRLSVEESVGLLERGHRHRADIGGIFPQARDFPAILSRLAQTLTTQSAAILSPTSSIL